MYKRKDTFGHSIRKTDTIFNRRKDTIHIWYKSWTKRRKKTFFDSIVDNSTNDELQVLESIILKKLKRKRLDFVTYLPNKIVIQILSILDPKSLCYASLVSWTWWKHIKSVNEIWKDKCINRGWFLNYEPTSNEDSNWMDHYKKCFQSIQKTLKINNLVDKPNIHRTDSIYFKTITISNCSTTIPVINKNVVFISNCIPAYEMLIHSLNENTLVICYDHHNTTIHSLFDKYDSTIGNYRCLNMGFFCPVVSCSSIFLCDDVNLSISNYQTNQFIKSVKRRLIYNEKQIYIFNSLQNSEDGQLLINQIKNNHNLSVVTPVSINFSFESLDEYKWTCSTDVINIFLDKLRLKKWISNIRECFLNWLSHFEVTSGFFEQKSYFSILLCKNVIFTKNYKQMTYLAENKFDLTLKIEKILYNLVDQSILKSENKTDIKRYTNFGKTMTKMKIETVNRKSYLVKCFLNCRRNYKKSLTFIEDNLYKPLKNCCMQNDVIINETVLNDIFGSIIKMKENIIKSDRCICEDNLQENSNMGEYLYSTIICDYKIFKNYIKNYNTRTNLLFRRYEDNIKFRALVDVACGSLLSVFNLLQQPFRYLKSQVQLVEEFMLVDQNDNDLHFLKKSFKSLNELQRMYRKVALDQQKSTTLTNICDGIQKLPDYIKDQLSQFKMFIDCKRLIFNDTCNNNPKM
ncbi:hypothetical protein A3Q56_02048 [Intoshia linei]|uniref:F-box domain-containing protein n=1 Tax=Intoshia linei TaxID=1819745 RepID=A0A177B7F5_9BILA|nr:hypothetical protein A3Q56_02048 [Intoshia linei]